MEYWRNHAIGIPSSKYDRAVIVIHGTNRNADDYYNRIITAADTEGVLEHTLVISPKFKTVDDLPNTNELYWSSSGWKKGFKSTNGNQTPSFSVVDHILDKITTNFPNITLVSIVGHSAGAQFVQRYGALNTKEQALPSRIQARYIVANPGSYMFLTNERPFSTSGCTDFDKYKYGLSDLPQSLAYTNLSQSNIQNQLASRSFYVLLGKNDTSRGGSLDMSCKADAQGLNRFERGNYYYQHIRDFSTTANHIKLEIDGVGHSSTGMFNSAEGRATIFNTTGFNINAGLNDAWYNPETDGQGFFITVFPDLGAVSLAWFTYDTDRPAEDATANLGDPGHRWLTAVGPIEGNQAIMEIEMTSGGLLDTPTLIDRTDPPGSDGTIILTFTSCNSAIVEYDIPSINRQGIVPIRRVANDNIVICEALSTD